MGRAHATRTVVSGNTVVSHAEDSPLAMVDALHGNTLRHLERAIVDTQSALTLAEDGQVVAPRDVEPIARSMRWAMAQLLDMRTELDAIHQVAHERSRGKR